jgi:hypothetical protein
MNVLRQDSRVFYEGACAVKVLPTCSKQWLPVNGEILPTGLQGSGFNQPPKIRRDIGPRFQKRQKLSGTANVCYPELSADDNLRRSDSRAMHAYIARDTERKLTKALVLIFELLRELLASGLF